MSQDALRSLAKYSCFIVELLERPSVTRSRVATWSVSSHTGITEGEVFFLNGFRLRLREELDFAAGLITAYGYEVYRGEQRLYWYDDFPHPNETTLASTFPHHKHVPPDIKRHRIPAPQLAFNRPNLPAIIEEIEDLFKA